MALVHAGDYWRDQQAVRADMELEAQRDPFIESNLAMLRAHIALVDLYWSGQLVHGVDPIPEVSYTLGSEQITLEREQQQVVEAIGQRVALALYWAKASTGDWDEGEGEPEEPSFMVDWSWDSAFAVLGPAGSGKSTTVMVAVEKARAAGARVVLACPTRMLVAAYRQKYPDLDVDSVHAVFQLFRPEHETLLSMATYDLVVLDEVSQISAAVFERLLRIWEAAGNQPALVFVGDFAQLKGVEPTQARDSPFWSTVFKFELRTMRRCRCAALRWKLELLRAAKPSQKQLTDILRGHRAPRRQNRQGYQAPSSPPSDDDIRAVFVEDPDTVFVTITKAAAAAVNDLAVSTFFPDQAPLAVLPGDPDANPANFYASEQRAWDPAPIPIFVGARIQLTRNIHKEMDYVNGMGATILGLQQGGVRVRTDTGFIVVVYPWTDAESQSTYHPLRLGYANTLTKLQGATLDSMTLYLDVPNIPAAGYVALSRVRYDKHWRFVGYLTRHHFTPA